MRAATREIHSVSDSLINLKLVVALTDKQLYGRALLLFYYIYAQLESAIKTNKDHEAFQGLHELLADIARADGIAKDLNYYLGEDWSTKYQPTSAVQAYVKHLQGLEKKAHAVCFSGGQMIQKLVKKSFAPPTGEGLNAFAFNVKSRMVLRNSIKDKINAVPCDEATTKFILAESMSCFKMNNQVVRSLDGTGNHILKFVLKWLIVIGLIIATYFFYVHDVI
ncbi:Heme oxygenase 2 [Phytophthora boehmeriae]|uniref:Heme oxygenase 2 n=1 Tax=Phytophthora boehmeriae TaxID=109152 RepID=A0A8T1WVH2_9STRA|nr:Heme oxygenase 2 [Phytophthora boehmeriae]